MKHFVLTFALFLFAADPVAAQSLHPPPVQAIAAQLTPAAVDLTPQQSAVIREQAPIHLSLNDDRWETRDHRRGAANGALVGLGISAIAIIAGTVADDRGACRDCVGFSYQQATLIATLPIVGASTLIGFAIGAPTGPKSEPVKN